jgi:carbon-monoxide dehydrogenase small subunit
MREGIDLTLTVNGEAAAVHVAADRTLADVLRDSLGLTGTKVGCGEGECGACSVMLDGLLVNSCLVPAVECEGAEVLTIEGLADRGKLHPIQEAFIRNGAVQCGFCTPGMIMAAYALVAENPQPCDEDIRRAFEGNLCRCTGYRKIVDAVMDLTGRAPEHADPEHAGPAGAKPPASSAETGAEVKHG